mmetsp:Transcript_33776/g.80158  ORF Transcript_33776/g.80158 Transcript_33776/m.80158 type:complete len:239 (-) Transcript_33776:756-1472(-)
MAMERRIHRARVSLDRPEPSWASKTQPDPTGTAAPPRPVCSRRAMSRSAVCVVQLVTTSDFGGGDGQTGASSSPRQPRHALSAASAARPSAAARSSTEDRCRSAMVLAPSAASSGPFPPSPGSLVAGSPRRRSVCAVKPSPAGTASAVPSREQGSACSSSTASTRPPPLRDLAADDASFASRRLRAHPAVTLKPEDRRRDSWSAAASCRPRIREPPQRADTSTKHSSTLALSTVTRLP